MWPTLQKYLLANSFLHNMFNDLLRTACYAAGTWAIAHGIVSGSTQENQLIGSLFFLGGLGWQWLENSAQAAAKASAAAPAPAAK
jgi:hypothetical protein